MSRPPSQRPAGSRERHGPFHDLLQPHLRRYRDMRMALTGRKQKAMARRPSSCSCKHGKGHLLYSWPLLDQQREADVCRRRVGSHPAARQLLPLLPLGYDLLESPLAPLEAVRGAFSESVSGISMPCLAWHDTPDLHQGTTHRRPASSSFRAPGTKRDQISVLLLRHLSSFPCMKLCLDLDLRA